MSDALSAPFETANEEGLSGLIPAGNYPAQIVDAKVGSLKSGKGEAVDITWVLDGGEYDNRHLFQKIILEHESGPAQAYGRKKFKSLLDACLIRETVTSVTPLLGKKAMLTVGIRKDESGQYDDQNEIKRTKPVVASWNGLKPASKPTAAVLKEASTTTKAFEAVDTKMNDSIPF
jgi:uncharacterized protein DUF669